MAALENSISNDTLWTKSDVVDFTYKILGFAETAQCSDPVFLPYEVQDRWTINNHLAGQMVKVEGEAPQDVVLRQADIWLGGASSSLLEEKGDGEGPGGYGDAIRMSIEVAGDSAFAGASDNDQFAFTDLPLGTAFFESISADFDSGLEWFDEEAEPINNDNDGGAGNLPRMVGAVPESGDVDVAVAGAQELGFLTAAAFFPIVLENAPNGTFVLVAGGISRLPVEYSLSDDADGRFDIDPLTGLITVEDGSNIDYEASVAHDVEVTTTFLDSTTDPIVETLTIFVRDINEAPTGIDVDNLSVEENVDGALIGIVTTEDQDIGDSHVYVVSDARFEVLEGQLKLNDGISLDHEVEPSVELSITAIDGGGLSVEQSFTIATTDINDAPEAVDDEGATTENAAVNIDVLANDTDADEDDGPGVFSLDSVSIASVMGLSGGGTGTVSIDGNQLRFDPGSDFDELEAGGTATVVVDYTMSDDDGASAAAQAVITVTGVNDAPAVLDVTAAAVEDGPAISGMFLGDDLDGDDDGTTLVYTITSLPSEGTVVDIDNEIFVFDPGIGFQDLGAGETRDVTFGYIATDNAGAVSSSATVTITVTGVNDAPVVEDVAVSAVEDGAAVTGAFDGDDVDSDDDGTTLTYTLVSLPSEGTVVDIDGDTFTFDPGGDFQDLAEGETRDVTFEYTATDAHGAVSNTGVVTVTVTGVNDAPWVEDVVASAVEDGAAVTGSFDGDDVDSDDDGTTLTYAITALPGEGAVVDNGDGTFTFDPGDDFQDLAAGETRDVSFDYTATDSHGAVSNTGVVTVTVTGVNDEPTDLSLSNNRVSENASNGTIVGTIWATDPDTEDGFEYALTDDAGGAFDIDPITGRLTVGDSLVLDFENPDFEGIYSIEISVTDPGGESFTERMDIVLTDFNEAPTAIEPAVGAVAPNPDNGTVVATLTTIDPDTTAWSPVAETFTYALLDNARGRFTLDDDEIVVADGARIEEGESYELLVRSTDKGGLSVDQLLIVSAAAPPAPFSAIAAQDEVGAFGGNEADTVLRPLRVMCGSGSSDPVDNDPSVANGLSRGDSIDELDTLMV